MSEPRFGITPDLPSPSSALLLCEEQTTDEERKIVRLLDFFAIPWKAQMGPNGDMDQCRGRYAIISSADCLASVMEAEGVGMAVPPCITKASSVYVYGFQANEGSTKLLRFLTGNPQANVRAIHAPETVMMIAGDSSQICGPMSGMQVRVTLQAPGYFCDVGFGGKRFQSIVRAGEGEIFGTVTCSGVPFYLSPWNRVVDISALSQGYFDVRKCFCEAVPLILFLRWTFPDAAWGGGETSASLIVDDPPLKRRYGFLDFGEALDLMRVHNFATTVAFIPWNWQRTHPDTLSLFQSHPESLSLVVHGCDHTASEFAERSPSLLSRKIRVSKQRMEHLRRRASINADRIMVFPQGRFSPETGRALKLNGFVAAVNTEVAPCAGAVNETTISDLWNIAIMRYGTFPIFTRRYSDHGIENFAFDSLLGKPCLITAHHADFRDHAQNLVDLVAHLNSLRWRLVWRPLGEAIRRSFKIRRLDHDTSVIHMFSSSLVLENPSSQPRKTIFLKEEGDSDRVYAVWVNNRRVEFSVEGELLRVSQTILPGETAKVRIVYRRDPGRVLDRDSIGNKIRVAAKRYLSEFRDNYVSRNDFLYESASKLKHLMR